MEMIFPNVITLNVGGLKFTTKKDTLWRASYFREVFLGVRVIDQDGDGCFFIDRNGQYFGHILELLRNDQYLPPTDVLEYVLKDAEYFGVTDVENLLEVLKKKCIKDTDDKMETTFPEVVKLNIGGLKFTARQNTLWQSSFFADVFTSEIVLAKDDDGCFFIDRNGQYFGHVLEFLRNDQYVPPQKILEDVLRDAEYFGVSALEDRLKELPPLYPFYTVHSENRKINQNYSELKNEVTNIARSGAPNENTKDFSNSTSQVVIRTIRKSIYKEAGYFENMFSRAPQLRIAYCLYDAHKILAGKYHKYETLFLEKNDINNFDGFIHTLLYDLRKEGYSVMLSSGPATKGSSAVRLDDLKVSNVHCDIYEYEAVDFAKLKFVWFYPNAEQS